MTTRLEEPPSQDDIFHYVLSLSAEWRTTIHNVLSLSPEYKNHIRDALALSSECQGIILEILSLDHVLINAILGILSLESNMMVIIKRRLEMKDNEENRSKILKMLFNKQPILDRAAKYYREQEGYGAPKRRREEDGTVPEITLGRASKRHQNEAGTDSEETLGGAAKRCREVLR